MKRRHRTTIHLLRPLAGVIALAITSAAIEPAVAADRGPVAAAPYAGPRKTIAVSGFDAAGTFLARYGDANATLSAMLAAELGRTNRFVVVERIDLDALVRETQMAQAGTTRGGSSGPLLGAQILVRGSVTEFDEQERGGGFDLRFNAGGGLLGGLGQQRSSGRMAISLRLIDAATGAVIATHRVERRVRNSQLTLQGEARGISLGTSQFEQAAIGRAAREAIAEATRALAATIERVPWEARVAEVADGRVYISAGRNANLAPGARLRAVRLTRTITDPASGEVLGSEQRTIADLVVESVHERYAIGRFDGQAAPQRGDVVHLIAT